ncbi:Metallo-dependent phosphatase-like protein [Haematococcus lacustris]
MLRFIFFCATACACSASALAHRHLTIAEIGSTANKSVTVLCNELFLGSRDACFDSRIPARGNDDYPWGSPEISYPTDGTPWGAHITGPYPDGTSYLITWYTGAARSGPSSSLQQPPPDHSSSQVKLWAESGSGSPPCSSRMRAPCMPCNTAGLAAWPHVPAWLAAVASFLTSLPAALGLTAIRPCPCSSSRATFHGRSITYQRSYTAPQYADYSYLSPIIHHVLVTGLQPLTRYHAVLGKAAGTTAALDFTTLPDKTTPASERYPLRVGIVADVGQTANSTATRDRLLRHDPRPAVILNVGDNSYSDNYRPDSLDAIAWGGTNQNRWDAYSVAWAPAFNATPVLNCIGNHELELDGIAAAINYTTTSFAYPDNYPFQSYAARWPVPGTRVADAGSINSALYYSTHVGGVMKLVTLNNYIPFHEGSPQYRWALQQLLEVDRDATPWLVVQFHAPIYHTYAGHYKEQECFRSVYEDLFYRAGVDLVLSGHVHAYERTHGMYDYKKDSCGPMYVVIGDGGNVEGPVRNFVDQRNPTTNLTYCEMLRTADGLDPNSVDPAAWGPDYQRMAHLPGCPTTSWQPASGVGGGPPLVLLASPDKQQQQQQQPLGFCQSSQPVWSAYRDPSFGHAVLTLLSPTQAELAWYRNVDPDMEPADRILLQRLDTCQGRRRTRSRKVRRRAFARR